jgi:hypothetical protein
MAKHIQYKKIISSNPGTHTLIQPCNWYIIIRVQYIKMLSRVIDNVLHQLSTKPIKMRHADSGSDVFNISCIYWGDKCAPNSGKIL